MIDVIIVSDTKHGFLSIMSTMELAKKSIELSYCKALDKPVCITNRYEKIVYMLPDNRLTLSRQLVLEEVTHL